MKRKQWKNILSSRIACKNETPSLEQHTIIQMDKKTDEQYL